MRIKQVCGAALVWTALALNGTAQTAPALDNVAELGTFLDGVYASVERTHHVPGMTLAVVRDGKVVLLRGYGYADLERSKRVDAERTLFRVGSITKTLTFTAAMQLVAEGRLDINAPIDQYLPEELQIQSPWRVQPTMKDLMSHTPGYDDVPLIGLFRHEPYKGTLKDALAELPALQVRKPGELVAYSNYGAALAGYVVERASGISWESYVEANILHRLNIANLTVRQPVPQELAADMATGYRWSNGQLKAQGFEYVPLAPAGGASASAASMAQYMIALLNYGQTPTANLLPEWAGHQMREPLYRGAPQLGAWLHGFYELRPAGPRVFGHGGATMWFHSLMALLPESNTGIFISVNADSAAEVPTLVYKAFLDRYYPRAVPPAPAPLHGAVMRSALAAGWYSSTRVARRTPARLMALGQSFEVSVAAPNALTVSGPAVKETKRYVEVEPWVYREERGEDLLVFRPVEGARPRVAFLSNNPSAAFERIGWFATPTVQIALPIVAYLVILIALFAYPVKVLRGHFRTPRVDRRIRASQLAAWLACAGYAACLGAMLTFLGDPLQLVFGMPGSMVLASWLGRAAAACTVLAAAATAILWARSFGRVGERIAHTVVVLAQIALALWMARWNLLG